MGTRSTVTVDIPPIDERAATTVRDRFAAAAAPAGSLGRLPSIVAQIAGIQGTTTPSLEQPGLVTMAADHGVATAGVSAYPQAATAVMVQTLAAGDAAASVLADSHGVDHLVVDMGVDTDGYPEELPIRVERINRGTANFREAPAMSRSEALRAINTGRRIVAEEFADADLIALGEMGIGNTTASAAITAALTDHSVAAVTGRGTGIDAETQAHKQAVIEEALATHDPDRTDGIDVLRAVGGYEIAGLVGVTLAAAHRRIPVLLDGVITGASALVAATLEPAVTEYLLAGHRSSEPGHDVQLDILDCSPVLDLDLSLGEGSGAVMAMPLLRSSCVLPNRMASLADLGLGSDS